MRRPVPLRLLLVGGAVLLLVLAVLGGVRACTAPRGLTFAQYQTLMRSGTLAGVANTLTSQPEAPTINLEQRRASYRNVPTCTTYWTSAEAHQLGTASALPVNADEDLVQGIDTELWDDPGAAAAALDAWGVCLRDFQEVISTSYPVKAVSHGASGEVVWQFTENLDLSSPVHLLTLRDRNVIAVFALPDGPDPDWRDQLITRFAADVEAASKK